MEYDKDKDGRIQADVARRLGIILEQYKRIKCENKYESTISLLVLQNLVIIFRDYAFRIRSMELPEKAKKLSLWGITEDMIIECSKEYNDLSVEKGFSSIRHSLCHPEFSENEKKRTGYTSVVENGEISGYTLFHYPPKRQNEEEYYIEIRLTCDMVEALIKKLLELFEEYNKKKAIGV